MRKVMQFPVAKHLFQGYCKVDNDVAQCTCNSQGHPIAEMQSDFMVMRQFPFLHMRSFEVKYCLISVLNMQLPMLFQFKYIVCY